MNLQKPTATGIGGALLIAVLAFLAGVGDDALDLAIKLSKEALTSAVEAFIAGVLALFTHAVRPGDGDSTVEPKPKE